MVGFNFNFYPCGNRNMVDISKDLNSKRFLFTYLVIIGFLLVLLMNRLPLMHEDLREIPSDMLSYLESPPRPLPSFSLLNNEQQELTQDGVLSISPMETVTQVASLL